MRNPWSRLLALAIIVAFAAPAMSLVDTAAQLRQARQVLTGEKKDADQARRLLLEIVQAGKSASDPETLIWADIYLGYIEDRAHNRSSAIAWFQLATSVEGASQSSHDLAASGLQRPLDWIRHLDATGVRPERVSPASSSSAPPPKPPSRAYVTEQPPSGMVLARDLSAKDRRENFESLWQLIDTNYAHFALKSIDWNDVHKRFRARLDAVTNDDDFYLLLFQLVNELRDTHSWLDNYHPTQPTGALDMPTDLFQGKPYVVGGDHAGWGILAVDGMTPAEKIEALRPVLKARSSERAFVRDAVRALLSGQPVEPVTVQLLSPDGKRETLTLKRNGSSRPRPAVPTVQLTRQTTVNYAVLPSGIGYIQIESFHGRGEIDDEFSRALEAVRSTPALVLDIRDNPGGFGHPAIVGRLLKGRTDFGISFKRNGPGHNDFSRLDMHAEPSGKWQYTRPIALLVNDITGSAADLFTLEVRSSGHVTVIGSTTHGNLSGTATYAVLPCGLVVRISNAFIADAKGHPVEVNGNRPDIAVEPSVQDYLAKRDPVLDRAVEVLLKNSKK
jgi:C-terminal processing protease CtpA/Prc